MVGISRVPTGDPHAVVRGRGGWGRVLQHALNPPPGLAAQLAAHATGSGHRGRRLESAGELPERPDTARHTRVGTVRELVAGQAVDTPNAAIEVSSQTES